MEERAAERPWEEVHRLQLCVPFSSEGAHAASGQGDPPVGAASHIQDGADFVSGEVSKPPAAGNELWSAPSPFPKRHQTPFLSESTLSVFRGVCFQGQSSLRAGPGTCHCEGPGA